MILLGDDTGGGGDYAAAIHVSACLNLDCYWIFFYVHVKCPQSRLGAVLLER
jgi:hypothetical protein